MLTHIRDPFCRMMIRRGMAAEVPPRTIVVDGENFCKLAK